MLNAQQSTEQRNPTPSPLPSTKADGQKFQRDRFDPVALGFWLGGACLGTAGCILGTCMPYHHPVAVAVGVLWWGIYLGCLGASIGAALGMLTERHPARPSQAPVDAETVPTGEYDPTLPPRSDDSWRRYGEGRRSIWTAKSD